MKVGFMIARRSIVGKGGMDGLEKGQVKAHWREEGLKSVV